MCRYGLQLLGIIDKLNDWNEKLNGFASKNLDNVWVGALIVGLVFIVSIWGINTLNRK